MSILQVFPTELWYEVVPLMEPRNVLSLSQTCQTMNSLLSTKAVWATVLRWICKEYMLFSPSYPIAQMDLSQIKYAALGPYRWSKALERHQRSPHSEMHGMPIFPILKHVHRSVIDPTIPVEHEKEPFLVPGGRFLIVTDHDMLQIMDLGVPGLPPLTPPNVICKVDLTEDWSGSTFFSIAVQETKAGGGLRVAVMTMGGGRVCVKVYDFFLSETNTYWERVGRICIAVECDSNSDLQLDEDWLLMPLDLVGESAGILIWNFAEGVYTLWNHPLVPGCKVAFLNDVVVCFAEDAMWAWPVQSWSVLPSDTTIPFERLSISEVVGLAFTPLQVGVEARRFTHLSPSNWYLRRDSPFLIDIVTASGRKVTGYRHQIEPDTSTYPWAQPTLLCTFSFPKTSRCWSISPGTGSFKFGFSSGSMVDTFLGVSQSLVYSILKPEGPENSNEETPLHDTNTGRDETPASTVVFTRLHEDGSGHWLCTSSGRMASVMITEGSEDKYILIDDYLSYHPSAAISV